jgi:hypothetical protein
MHDFVTYSFIVRQRIGFYRINVTLRAVRKIANTFVATVGELHLRKHSTGFIDAVLSHLQPV